MVPSEAHGVLAAVGAALFRNCILLLGKFMQQKQLPYLFLAGHSPHTLRSLTSSIICCYPMLSP